MTDPIMWDVTNIYSSLKIYLDLEGSRLIEKLHEAFRSSESYPEVYKSKPRTMGSPLSLLTERKHRILDLVANGHSNKEVAVALFLSEKTVKHHMTNILQKLQVRNRVEAVLLARGDSRTIDE